MPGALRVAVQGRAGAPVRHITCSTRGSDIVRSSTVVTDSCRRWNGVSSTPTTGAPRPPRAETAPAEPPVPGASPPRPRSTGTFGPPPRSSPPFSQSITIASNSREVPLRFGPQPHRLDPVLGTAHRGTSHPHQRGVPASCPDAAHSCGLSVVLRGGGAHAGQTRVFPRTPRPRRTNAGMNGTSNRNGFGAVPRRTVCCPSRCRKNWSSSLLESRSFSIASRVRACPPSTRPRLGLDT